ncbi:hypothetical protein ANH9776_04525 [Aggregatibacter actinomycetemcomitans serotype e str. ANH9776]|nr:hypothetical protein SA3096_02555 [Aggregatibacter actinomycetemcomitans serotype e str. SA3096]KYK95388.1 hypothetical protein ANH9776_04525 [Aggregatibacter actinomycetemcomitans serotype e str. ANH9776]
MPFILVKKRIEKRPHFTGKKCGHKMQRFLNVGAANNLAMGKQASL